MKKILALVLCAFMMLNVFTACGENKEAETVDTSEPRMTFASIDEMKEIVDSVWMNCNSGDYLIIKDGQVSTLNDQIKQDTLNKLGGKINNFDSFENFYMGFTQECGEAIEYDYENGSIILNSTGKPLFEMYDAYSAFDESHIMYTKNAIPESDLKSDIAEEYINLKYPDAITNKDAQFDKYGNTGKNFKLFGSAELDDYYNWAYSDYESGYFCIKVRPTGGNISDEWYIYASRDDFSELYERLKNGSKTVKIIATLVYADTGSNNMATLVECV